MNQARAAIAVLTVALLIVACRDSCQVGATHALQAGTNNTIMIAGDAPTSPVPPGNSSRIVRPPDPGAVRSPDQLRNDPPETSWRVYFFTTDAATDPPLAISVVPDLYLDIPWQAALPDTQLAPQIEFSLWVRNIEFEGGAIRMYLWAEGGVQLWVNDRLVIDEGEARQVRPEIGDVWLDRSGPTEVRIAYRPTTPDGRLRVWWEQVTTFAGWRGEYFPNRFLTGQPLIVRNDPRPVFDWGLDSPAPDMPADDFAVRWSRAMTFEGGLYRVSVEADDGVRVFLDGALLINAWDQGYQGALSREVELAGGEHSIMIEYYEVEGEARVAVSWERLDGATDGDALQRTAPPASAAPATAQQDTIEPSVWTQLLEFLRRLLQRLVGAPIA